MRRRKLTTSALGLLPILAAVLLAATPAPRPQPSVSIGRLYFGDAYQPAIGRWLPAFGNPLRFGVSNSHVTRGVSEDRIVDDAAPARKDKFDAGPVNGTFFTYGDAGPPQVHATYDAVRRVVYYSQGCCSWHSTVVSSGVRPPPVHTHHADLSRVHTAIGARLGDSVQHIEQLYGVTNPTRLTHPRNMVMYAYYVPEKNDAMCAEEQQFGFIEGRLVYIQIMDAC